MDGDEMNLQNARGGDRVVRGVETRGAVERTGGEHHNWCQKRDGERASKSHTQRAVQHIKPRPALVPMRVARLSPRPRPVATASRRRTATTRRPASRRFLVDCGRGEPNRTLARGFPGHDHST